MFFLLLLENRIAMKKQDPEGVTLAGTLLNDSFESDVKARRKRKLVS